VLKGGLGEMVRLENAMKKRSAISAWLQLKIMQKLTH
jgi:hypothetical protein